MAYTLRQLSYAVAVADSGSITDASEQLGVSQPAVSAALRGLEEEFGLDLFIRRPARRLALSRAGQHFINRARHLLEEAHEFETDAAGLSRDLRGVLEVGCFLPTAPFMVPLVMQRLAESHPEMEIRLHEGDLDELNQWLAGGRIEVAMTYDMHPHPGITFEPLIETPVYALLAASDPLSRAASVSLADLADRNMIAFDLPITQQFYRGLFLSQGIVPKVTKSVRSYEMVRSLVGAGMGFSLLIMRPVNDRSYNGNALAYVPLAGDLPRPCYGLASVSSTLRRRLLRAFFDECRQVLKDEKQADGYYVRLD